MDRRLHSFTKKPFLKWYHKCSVCGTIKIWMPMVKCTDCKIYSHQVCLPTAGCPSPIVRGPAEDLTTIMIPLPLDVDNSKDRHAAEEHRENIDRLNSGVQSEAQRRLVSDAPHLVSSAITIIDKPIALEEERELENKPATRLNNEDSGGNETEALLRKDGSINIHRNENLHLSGIDVEHLQAKTNDCDDGRSPSAKLVDNQVLSRDDQALETRVAFQDKNTAVRGGRAETSLRDTIAQYSSTRNIFPDEVASMPVKASIAVFPSTKAPSITSMTIRASVYRPVCRPVDATMRESMKELYELFPDTCELPFGRFFFGGQIDSNNRD